MLWIFEPQCSIDSSRRAQHDLHRSHWLTVEPMRSCVCVRVGVCVCTRMSFSSLKRTLCRLGLSDRFRTVSCSTATVNSPLANTLAKVSTNSFAIQKDLPVSLSQLGLCDSERPTLSEFCWHQTMCPLIPEHRGPSVCRPRAPRSIHLPTIISPLRLPKQL